MLAILLVSGGPLLHLRPLVKDRRQGRALLAAMLVIFVPLLVLSVWAEKHGNPLFSSLDGCDQRAGGNMEGKEVRFGIANSALWATVTTAASNGSVNSMHDSFTPLGGLVPMWLMQLGEIVFGGVGSGLYGMLMFAIIAVFIAGLMVGRTPEYLGKKIEAFEMKMASLVILLPPAAVLVGTAIACVLPAGLAGLGNPGAHGFSEILYAFSSAANNNGSAFAGLTASGAFYGIALGLCMLIGRYWVIVPVLAIAGSLAKKKSVPPSRRHAAHPHAALRRAAGRHRRARRRAHLHPRARARPDRRAPGCCCKTEHAPVRPLFEASHRPPRRRSTPSSSSTRAAW